MEKIETVIRTFIYEAIRFQFQQVEIIYYSGREMQIFQECLIILN